MAIVLKKGVILDVLGIPLGVTNWMGFSSSVVNTNRLIIHIYVGTETRTMLSLSLTGKKHLIECLAIALRSQRYQLKATI